MANIGYIQVNRHCNNACHFCSNPSNGNNISYERGIELIDDFIKRGYRGVIFTGWEPTLSPDLPKWITYTVKKWIGNRIISNGMLCSKPEYMKKLSDAGLELVHFSVFTYHAKIHDFLTDTPWSWIKLMKSITNALNCGVRVQINTVINHYNQEHLDKTVKFLVKHFPQIQHYVWNNLDPEMMRKTQTAWSTLPDFDIFSTPLKKAIKYLEDSGRTCRAEKIPLCYIWWFEHVSTETRKIVKSEERIVHFLDFREMMHETQWDHWKPSECKNCDLKMICGWIYERKKYYNFVNVYPQKLNNEEKKSIIYKIKWIQKNIANT